MNANTLVTDNTAELSTGKAFYRDSGGSGVPAVFLHAASGSSMLQEHRRLSTSGFPGISSNDHWALPGQ
jgi:hypothetical protein